MYYCATMSATERPAPNILSAVNGELRKQSRKEKKTLWGDYETVKGAASVYIETEAIIKHFGERTPYVNPFEKTKPENETKPKFALTTPPVRMESVRGNIWLQQLPFFENHPLKIVFQKDGKEPGTLFDVHKHETHQYGYKDIVLKKESEYGQLKKLLKFYVVAVRLNQISATGHHT